MRSILIALGLCACAIAQTPEVSISQAPGPNPYQVINGYSGSNLIYTCYARTTVPSPGNPFSISAASNANPVSFTSASHGFNANSRPLVTISGGTGNWTAVNGTFTATITGTGTFTIPVDSTGFGALTGTLTFTTSAPQTNQPVWAVKLYAYDASSNPIWVGWLGGNSAFRSKCSDATSTSTNIQ